MQTNKTSRLFWVVVLITLAVTPSTAQAYTVHGHAECQTTGWAPYGAKVEAYEVDPFYGGTYTTDPTPICTATVKPNGDFTLAPTYSSFSTWPPTYPSIEYGDPDLVFRFLQSVNGVVETIYDETPSETHWNVADGDLLNFIIASPLAICVDPNQTSPLYSEFLFTRIGSYHTTQREVDCKLPGGTGYGNPHTAGFSGWEVDQPFGDVISLFGWFGSNCPSNLYYYKLQYSTDNGTSWIDYDEPLNNSWLNETTYELVTEAMGPHTIDNILNLYIIPYAYKSIGTAYWVSPYILARFNTNHVPDGKCIFRIIGYEKSPVSGKVKEIPSWSNYLHPEYGKIVLQIDNSEPTVEIKKIMVDGNEPPPCGKIFFNTGDKIEVSFQAHDNRGHLGRYLLQAMYGHNCSVYPEPSGAKENYSTHASSGPLWQGSTNYTAEYKAVSSSPGPGEYIPGSAMPCSAGQMPTCGYQFRLKVWKRTTDGYHLIYRDIEDTWHVCIER